MRAFLGRAARTVGLYVLVVAGGTLLFLLGAAFIGYAPSSDRPGPGWYGWRGALSVAEIRYFGGWLVFLLPPALIVGTALALTAEVLQLLRSPRWILSTTVALLSGLLSLLIVDATGWMIAIGSLAVFVAGALGMVFGGLILPRTAAHPDTGVGVGARGRTVIVTLWLLSLGVIVFPFLPRQWTDPGYGVRIDFIQLTPRDEDMNTVSGLSAEDIAMLVAAGVRGRLRENASFSGCSGDGCRRNDHPHVTVILEQPVEHDVLLAEPAPGGRVIYVQRRAEWTRLPVNAKLSKRMLSLRPGDTKNAFTYRVEGGGWETVRWLP